MSARLVSDVLAPDFQARPFWWDDAMPLPAPAAVPSKVDVAIIGSGYCGLSAARILARHGLNVAVLDANEPGFGGSSRNSGHVLGPARLPPNLPKLIGAERAAAVYADCQLANQEFRTFISDEAPEVDFEANGRFLGAHSPEAYEELQKRGALYRKAFKLSIRNVPKSEQRAEVGSDYYHGGIVIEDAASIHPGKLHKRMRHLAEEEGVTVCGNARVEQIARQSARFLIRTARGSLTAAKVISATNGYAESVLPYVRRRIVPVTPYMVATEPLPPEMAARILPTKRNGGDTKRLIYAFRRSPDGLRVIFTGRPRGNHVDEHAAAGHVHRMMCDIWPELAPFRISHSWKGFIAFTFDRMPHIAEHDGVHFAAGCQGAGVVMMTFLGRQIALKILGRQGKPCGFDLASFPSSPFYNGDPWFLPPLEAYYGFRDRMEQKSHCRGKMKKLHFTK